MSNHLMRGRISKCRATQLPLLVLVLNQVKSVEFREKQNLNSVSFHYSKRDQQQNDKMRCALATLQIEIQK